MTTAGHDLFLTNLFQHRAAASVGAEGTADLVESVEGQGRKEQSKATWLVSCDLFMNNATPDARMALQCRMARGY